MIDREKVKDAFKNCITKPKCKDCHWELCELFDQKKVSIPLTLALDVLKLLKEQESVEPLAIKRAMVDEFYGAISCCPKCDCMWIMSWENDMHYCPKCGQAVKWDD